MRYSSNPYKHSVTKAIFLLLGLGMYIPAAIHAQTTDTFALYIAPNATLYVNGTTQMSISSKVIQSGSFGTVKGTTVHMFGDLWRNIAGSFFPDESGTNSFSGTGGIFRFANPSFPQFLSGGYSVTAKNGPSFPNLVVSNPRGIYLDENADAQVRNNLHFENGMLWLNGNNLLIGTTTPGSITGYNENKFIGTENTVKGGFLYRAKISGASGSVVFPVGPQAGSYAPLSIMFNAAIPQDLHVRVFDDIYSKAFFGPTGSPASIQQTWNMGQENNSKVPAIIALQHNAVREGAAFTAHRGNSFISMYDFTQRTWDTVGPSGVTSPGTLTTGAPNTSTYINTRVLDSLGQNVYLTKTADKFSDSITLAKASLTPVRQPDGSFRVTYIFLVKNAGVLPANTIQIFDTLSKVFTLPTTFAVASVSTSGNLVPNNAFDGVTQTGLLLPPSKINARSTDTVTLVLNVVPNNKDAYYYNTAYLAGIINGNNNNQYFFNNGSVDGVIPPAPGTNPLPTPTRLTAAKYQMPEGFSPNGDGVNDRLVIGNLGNDKAELWIFSKQGILVYRNPNYHNDWDGYYNQNQGGLSSNRKVEDGTYFYKIVITEATTGNKETYYGYISIWK